MISDRRLVLPLLSAMLICTVACGESLVTAVAESGCCQVNITLQTDDGNSFYCSSSFDSTITCITMNVISKTSSCSSISLIVGCINGLLFACDVCVQLQVCSDVHPIEALKEVNKSDSFSSFDNMFDELMPVQESPISCNQAEKLKAFSSAVVLLWCSELLTVAVDTGGYIMWWWSSGGHLRVFEAADFTSFPAPINTTSNANLPTCLCVFPYCQDDVCINDELCNYVDLCKRCFDGGENGINNITGISGTAAKPSFVVLVGTEGGQVYSTVASASVNRVADDANAAKCYYYMKLWRRMSSGVLQLFTACINSPTVTSTHNTGINTSHLCIVCANQDVVCIGVQYMMRCERPKPNEVDTNTVVVAIVDDFQFKLPSHCREVKYDYLMQAFIYICGVSYIPPDSVNAADSGEGSVVSSQLNVCRQRGKVLNRGAALPNTVQCVTYEDVFPYFFGRVCSYEYAISTAFPWILVTTDYVLHQCCPFIRHKIQAPQHQPQDKIKRHARLTDLCVELSNTAAAVDLLYQHRTLVDREVTQLFYLRQLLSVKAAPMTTSQEDVNLDERKDKNFGHEWINGCCNIQCSIRSSAADGRGAAGHPGHVSKQDCLVLSVEWKLITSDRSVVRALQGRNVECMCNPCVNNKPSPDTVGSGYSLSCSHRTESISFRFFPQTGEYVSVLCVGFEIPLWVPYVCDLLLQVPLAAVHSGDKNINRMNGSGIHSSGGGVILPGAATLVSLATRTISIIELTTAVSAIGAGGVSLASLLKPVSLTDTVHGHDSGGQEHQLHFTIPLSTTLLHGAFRRLCKDLSHATQSDSSADGYAVKTSDVSNVFSSCVTVPKDASVSQDLTSGDRSLQKIIFAAELSTLSESNANVVNNNIKSPNRQILTGSHPQHSLLPREVVSGNVDDTCMNCVLSSNSMMLLAAVHAEMCDLWLRQHRGENTGNAGTTKFGNIHDVFAVLPEIQQVRVMCI